jgi:hypothetical protein
VVERAVLKEQHDDVINPRKIPQRGIRSDLCAGRGQ